MIKAVTKTTKWLYSLLKSSRKAQLIVGSVMVVAGISLALLPPTLRHNNRSTTETTQTKTTQPKTASPAQNTSQTPAGAAAQQSTTSPQQAPASQPNPTGATPYYFQKDKPPAIGPVTRISLSAQYPGTYWFETDGASDGGYMIVWYRIDRYGYDLYVDKYPASDPFWKYYGGQSTAGFSYAVAPQQGNANLVDRTTLNGDYQIYICTNAGGSCGVRSNTIIETF